MLMMNAYPRWSFLAVPLLAALGCSDPVPPPAQGAMTLYIGSPVTPVDQMSCPVTQTYQVGAVDSKTKMVSAPTSTSTGESIISGESGATITCSVKGSNGTFAFSGSIHGITTQGSQVSLQFNGGTIGPDMTGTANVVVYTPELSSNFSSPTGTPCTVNILEGQIKGGSMWATFSCPQIASPPSGLCGISAQSAVVFENCAGS
jgi:hypothetical protein